MITAFPAPVLAVAADAVRELDGGDALSGLWTLFTKCKESLKDGRRLENISWRLWYREMATAQSYRPLTPESASPHLSESKEQSSFFPSFDGRDHVHHQVLALHPPIAHPKHQSNANPKLHSSASSCSHHPPSSSERRALPLPATPSPTPASPHTSFPHSQKQSASIGSIICDILPHAEVLHPPKRPPSSPPSPLSVLLGDEDITVSTGPGTSANPNPTTTNAAVFPLPPVPAVRLPSTPPASASVFPRVVVVNPTPHPTPPATPVLESVISPPAQPHASHLLPPLPPPALRALLHPRVHPPPASQSHHQQSQQQSQPQSQSQSQLQQTQAPSKGPAADATLKPSDRRFFLQQSPERPSPEHTGTSPAHSSDAGQPSSVSSHSQVHAKKDEVRRPGLAVTGRRRSKGRGVTTATMMHRVPSGRGQRKQEKVNGKEKEKVRPTFNIGSTSSTGSKSGISGSSRSPAPALAPMFAQVLAQVSALPEAPRRRIVVANTSSEYETTDTEDDGDEEDEEMEEEGSWEDMSPPEDGAPVKSGAKGKAVMKEKEKDKTRDREREGKHDKEHEREEKEAPRLRAAALEAQRHREMFAKIPKRSYSNLGARTQSGLLSQLMHPDPALFRASQSSQDLLQHAGMSGIAMTRSSRAGAGAGPSMLQTSKSSATLSLTQISPVAMQPSVMGSKRNASTRHSHDLEPGHGHEKEHTNASANGAYRPKGRPQGQEMEDDSDSEGENADDTIQISRSIAQEKLAALAGRRTAPANARAHASPPATIQPNNVRSRTTPTAPPTSTRPTLTSVATAPIPLGHPYNLPPPAAPSTPRTTRRKMLSTELSESLRRNLLWERQVSKVSMVGGARRQNSTGGILGGGLKPLTTVNGEGEGSRDAAAATTEQREREEQRRRALARNRSWADDYHYSGW